MQKIVMRRLTCAVPIVSLMALGAVSAHAQAFTAGDIVVYRVGTGSAALSSVATSVFLDEYTTSGTLVESIAMPTSISGTNQMLTASGSATSEGELNLSANGQYLALTGYNAATGTAGVASTASSSVARVVGIVGVSGTVDTTTALSSAGISGNNIRAAYTTDGTSIYIANAVNGVDYTTIGSTGTSAPTPIETSITNARDVVVSNGQLYVSTSSGSTFRIAAVGTGTPTTAGQTVTEIPSNPATGAGSILGTTPYAFSFVTLGGGTTPNTLYVADTNSIDKFSLISGAWMETGTITGVAGIEGLTVSTSNGIASLYATDPTGIYGFTDTTGFGGTASGAAALLASAGTNEAFRGVAFAPSAAGAAAAAPEPVSLLLGAFGLLPIGVVVRRRISLKA